MTETWFVKSEGGKLVHNWLSNFYIEPDGTNVEAEFQAAKHSAYPWRAATILRLPPGKAKKLGRKFPLSEAELKQWDAAKIAAMHYLVACKIEDHPEIAMALIATGDANLVEQNFWHDNFWGNCTCLRCYKTGDNYLGQIWMKLREEIGAAG